MVLLFFILNAPQEPCQLNLLKKQIVCMVLIKQKKLFILHTNNTAIKISLLNTAFLNNLQRTDFLIWLLLILILILFQINKRYSNALIIVYQITSFLQQKVVSFL